MSFPLVEACLEFFFWYGIKLSYCILMSSKSLNLTAEMIFSLGNKKKLHQPRVGEYEECCTCTILCFTTKMLIQKQKQSELALYSSRRCLAIEKSSVYNELLHNVFKLKFFKFSHNIFEIPPSIIFHMDVLGEIKKECHLDQIHGHPLTSNLYYQPFVSLILWSYRKSRGEMGFSKKKKN